MAEELGDNMTLRPSKDFQGHMAVVAIKDDQDICANCFRPLVDFRDVPCGSVYLRICTNRACAHAVAREREGKPRSVVAEAIGRAKNLLKR